MPSVFQNLETSSAATEVAVESIDAKTPPLIAADTIPTEFTTAVPVQSVPQRQHRLGFSKVVAANAVDTDMLSIVFRSAGVGVSQGGGNLVITTGTTANQEIILRGLETYSGGVRLSCASFLSQRIANQSFIVELVDVLGDALAATIASATSMTVTLPSVPTQMSVGQAFTVGGYSGTGTLPSQRATIASIASNVITLTIAGGSAGTGTVSAFGWSYYQVVYSGTTATAATYNNQRYGWKDTDTTLTINTTVSPGHAIIISGNDARARVSDQVVTSATSPNITDRAYRAVNVPDDQNLYLQLRSVNGTTNPASTTTWTIGSVTIANFAGQDVVIQDQRQAPSMHTLDARLAAGSNIVGAVTGSGTFTVGGSLTSAGTTTNTPATPTTTRTITTTTTNTSFLKASAGTVYNISIFNQTASPIFVKLYNQTTAPTLASAVPVLVIPVLAGAVFISDFGPMGERFATGIAMAITGAAANTDTTATAAGAMVNTTFI
jgi:hypothetical protein